MQIKTLGDTYILDDSDILILPYVEDQCKLMISHKGSKLYQVICFGEFDQIYKMHEFIYMVSALYDDITLLYLEELAELQNINVSYPAIIYDEKYDEKHVKKSTNNRKRIKRKDCRMIRRILK